MWRLSLLGGPSETCQLSALARLTLERIDAAHSDGDAAEEAESFFRTVGREMPTVRRFLDQAGRRATADLTPVEAAAWIWSILVEMNDQEEWPASLNALADNLAAAAAEYEMHQAEPLDDWTTAYVEKHPDVDPDRFAYQSWVISTTVVSMQQLRSDPVLAERVIEWARARAVDLGIANTDVRPIWEQAQGGEDRTD